MNSQPEKIVMDHLTTRRFAQTDLVLPLLGFGGASLNSPNEIFSIDEARKTISAALSAGIGYFDTAPLYSYGMSERLIGDALRENDKPVILSTKVGRLLRPNASPFPGQPEIAGVPFGLDFDYSHAGTIRSIEDSMQRMGVDRFDIAFIHDIDLVTHGDRQPARFREAMEGAFPALVELKRAGIVGAIGLGVNEWEVCADALKVADIDCFLLAGRYTLIDNDVLDEFLPLCRSRKVSLIIGGPYNSGVLAVGPKPNATFDYRPVPPEIAERVFAIAEVCNDYDVSLAAAALQFPAGEDCVVSIIPGARTAEETEQNVGHFNCKIPAGLWDALKSEGLLRADAPVPDPC